MALIFESKWFLTLAALFLLALPMVSRAQDSAVPGQTASADQVGQAAPPNQPEAVPPEKPISHDDRIFGIMPNFLTVEGEDKVPPLGVKGKFKITAQGAFDPYEFTIVGIIAGLHQAADVDPSLGQGMIGYGKRYGIGLADQVSGNFLVGAILPSLLRQDPRYYQMGKGSFARRFFYALSRVIVARTDSGARQVNYSEILGNGAAAGLSNVYSPQADRGISNTLLTWGEQLSIDGFGNELKEFWPDIKRRFEKKKHPQA
jgi:hypothetical protein